MNRPPGRRPFRHSWDDDSLRTHQRACRPRAGLLGDWPPSRQAAPGTADLLAPDHLPDPGFSRGGKASDWNACRVSREVWLFTIGEAGRWPLGGERVAEIGPLPLNSRAKYTARYLEAVFAPGMISVSHRHGGPEAWFTLAGATRLETPEGKFVGRAGGAPVIVPGGLSMHLTAIGTEQRSALVLILFDSARPHTTAAPDWTPKGLCTDRGTWEFESRGATLSASHIRLIQQRYRT